MRSLIDVAKRAKLDHIRKALARHDNNRTQTARALAIDVRYLRRLIRQYGLK